jgi:hypothetical protein
MHEKAPPAAIDVAGDDAANEGTLSSVSATEVPLTRSIVAVAHDTIRRDDRGKAILHLIA